MGQISTDDGHGKWVRFQPTLTAKGNSAVDYCDTMPVDLAPMIVLDASGRVRQTYADMEQYRGTVKRLRSAPKSYRNLTINVWRRGGGKSSFRESFDELAEGIIRTIRAKPDNEEWLIVHHKPSKKTGDIKAAIEKAVENPERLRWVSWGRHQATNDYGHIRNVILAGTLFYRPSHYEALKRLGAARATDKVVTDDERQGVERGEHADLILQALCRAAVRKSTGDACGHCDAYIIATTRSGIPDALPWIFPDCDMKEWNPLPVTLAGRLQEASEILLSLIQPGKLLKFTEVQQRMGIDRSNFKTKVRQHPQFVRWLEERGIVEAGGQVYFTGWLRV